jgi:hypothetical protein
MALGVGILAGGIAAQGSGSEFSAYAKKDGEVVVGRGGASVLTFKVAAWKPKWAWTGVDGKLAAQDGAAVGRLAIDLGDKDHPARLDVRAEQVAPNQIRVQYVLRSEVATDLTLVVVEMNPGAELTGRDASVEADGATVSRRFPLDRSGLGQRVSAVQFQTRDGKPVAVRFDLACAIESDGAGRIVLAKDHLAAGSETRVGFTLELPGPVDWVSDAAALPDEAAANGWYEWRATSGADDGPLSLSGWLDRPAGRLGRVVAHGDRLMVGDRPIRLWGVNVCYGDCIPEKTEADNRAAFYARYGINAVRLHKFADGHGWNGCQSVDSFAEYDPALLDRMDYQVSALKNAGIYVTLSAHFGAPKLGPKDVRFVPYLNEFGPFRDGRVEVPHSALAYSPEIQDAHIAQIVNLLKHQNPYTRQTYAKDPAIAFVEIVNEQSILFYTSMAPLKASPTLRAQTAKRFCDWLRAKYGDAQGLKRAWGEGALNALAGEGIELPGGESLERNTILPLGSPWYWDPAQLAGSQAKIRVRLLDSLEFLYSLQCAFYDRCVKAVREAGYEGEMIGSNWQAGRALSHYANLHSDDRVGTIDRHNYFEGPVNATMFARPGSGVISTGLQQTAGRPFMLSEWIHVFPNEQGVEGPAIIGAYGLGLQGWDASFLFQNGDDAAFRTKLGDTWDVVTPQILGVFPAVSRVVLRGDVKESPVVSTRFVSMPSLFRGELGFDDRVEQGYDSKELDGGEVPARSLVVERAVVRFQNRPERTPRLDLKPFERDGWLVSATGQLRWREPSDGGPGCFVLDTPGAKAVVGYASGLRCDLGDRMRIEPATRFGAIYVVARDASDTLATARQALIVAMARARNSGTKLSPTGTEVLDPGKPPIVVEPVQARLTFGERRPVRVVLLDHDGRPTSKTLPVQDGVVAIDGRRDQTPYYLVEFGSP